MGPTLRPAILTSEPVVCVRSELSHTHLCRCSDPPQGEGLWGQEAWPGPQLSSRHSTDTARTQHGGITLQGSLCGLSPLLFLKQFSLIEIRFMGQNPHPFQVCSLCEFFGETMQFPSSPVTPSGLIHSSSNAPGVYHLQHLLSVEYSPPRCPLPLLCHPSSLPSDLCPSLISPGSCLTSHHPTSPLPVSSFPSS